jgi:transposase
MADNLDILNAAVSLLIKAARLAARFSGRLRQRSLKRLAAKDADAKAKEILFLKDRVYQLEMQVSILQKQHTKKGTKPRYEVGERLLILWYMEAFQIPRRKVSRSFGIARSTLYRWLHQIEDEEYSGTPANKTPTEIATLVWEMTKANLSWGRIRIANQLKLLGIFLSASTVRNILQRPKPRDTPCLSSPCREASGRSQISLDPGLVSQSRLVGRHHESPVLGAVAHSRPGGHRPFLPQGRVRRSAGRTQHRLDRRGSGAGDAKAWRPQTHHF